LVGLNDGSVRLKKKRKIAKNVFVYIEKKGMKS